MSGRNPSGFPLFPKTCFPKQVSLNGRVIGAITPTDGDTAGFRAARNPFLLLYSAAE